MVPRLLTPFIKLFDPTGLSNKTAVLLPEKEGMDRRFLFLPFSFYAMLSDNGAARKTVMIFSNRGQSLFL